MLKFSFKFHSLVISCNILPTQEPQLTSILLTEVLLGTLFPFYKRFKNVFNFRNEQRTGLQSLLRLYRLFRNLKAIRRSVDGVLDDVFCSLIVSLNAGPKQMVTLSNKVSKRLSCSR